MAHRTRPAIPLLYTLAGSIISTIVVADAAWAVRDPFSKSGVRISTASKTNTPSKTNKAKRSYSASSTCKKKLAAFRLEYTKYNGAANRYWSAVEKKRRLRRVKAKKGRKVTKNDYVLSHPPQYNGPKWPPCANTASKSKKSKKAKSSIGVVNDFLRAAKREYGFVPSHTSERRYKQAYAAEALSVGLSAEMVVGVYALETGGIGPYARQSGIFIVDQQCRPIRAKGRPASTALGYAQLLAANSAAMAAKHGPEFAARFENEARRSSPERARQLKAKARILRAMARDVKRGIRRYKRRNGWSEYIKFSKTSRGYAVHTLNLDADIGPMLQVHKLLAIKQFARKKGINLTSSAQLELMNLVGPGRGAEMMSSAARDVPTSNFFSRKGYERNPVSKNLTSRQLLGKLGSIINKKMQKCGSLEFKTAFEDVRRARPSSAEERVGLNQ